jgi:hypothetical protein
MRLLDPSKSSEGSDKWYGIQYRNWRAAAEDEGFFFLQEVVSSSMGAIEEMCG